MQVRRLLHDVLAGEVVATLLYDLLQRLPEAVAGGVRLSLRSAPGMLAFIHSVQVLTSGSPAIWDR